VFGHIKSDGRLGRNYLLGLEGNRNNAILCGSGQNIRKLLRAFLIVSFLETVQNPILTDGLIKYCCFFTVFHQKAGVFRDNYLGGFP
jgi:hypothetical protein